MNLAVYVNYRGNCEEAFRFYQEHLGAKTDSVIRRHGDMPNPNVPADWADKVVHARLEIGSTVLMGADIPNAEPMRSSYLTLCWTLNRKRSASTPPFPREVKSSWTSARPRSQTDSQCFAIDSGRPGCCFTSADVGNEDDVSYVALQLL